MNSTTLTTALALASLGLRVIRLCPNSKVPLDRDWPSLASSDETVLMRWFQDGESNLGLLTGCGGIVVIDCDTEEFAKKFFNEHRNLMDKTAIVKTRRGAHFYFRKADAVIRNIVGKDLNLDIRGTGGFVVAPGSKIDSFTYHWVENHELKDLEQLPEFSWDLVPELVKQRRAQTLSKNFSNESFTYYGNIDDRSKRALAYIRKIKAISGQNGHAKTYRVFCVLRDKFELPGEEAWHIARIWNSEGNADPPWSLTELRHKYEDVFYKQSKK